MAVELLTTDQVATELQVTTRTVYELYRRGDIKPIKLGRRTARVTRAELNSYIAKRVRVEHEPI